MYYSDYAKAHEIAKKSDNRTHIHYVERDELAKQYKIVSIPFAENENKILVHKQRAGFDGSEDLEVHIIHRVGVNIFDKMTLQVRKTRSIFQQTTLPLNEAQKKEALKIWLTDEVRENFTFDFSVIGPDFVATIMSGCVHREPTDFERAALYGRLGIMLLKQTLTELTLKEHPH